MTPLSPTAEDILKCARELITAGGYNSFSYADIARVVGIRNASIHHHFPTKAELVQVLVARYREEAAQGLAALERNLPDPAEALGAYVGYWRGCLMDGSAPFCVCALLAGEIPVLPEAVVREVRAHFAGLSAWLGAMLERGAREGRLTLTDPAETEAQALMAVIHGGMLSARAFGDPALFGRAVQPCLDRLIPPAST